MTCDCQSNNILQPWLLMGASVILGALLALGTAVWRDKEQAKAKNANEAKQQAIQVASVISRIVSHCPIQVKEGQAIPSVFEVSQDHSGQYNGHKVAGYLLDISLQLSGTAYENDVKPLVEAIQEWIPSGTHKDLESKILIDVRDSLLKKVKSMPS